MAVKFAREKAGLTASDLAGQVGIDRSALSRVENGVRSLDFSEAVAIATAVKIDVEALRTYAETFEREGVDSKRTALREIEKDLNRLQRMAVETAIELSKA